MAETYSYVGKNSKVYISECYEVRKYKDNCGLCIAHDGRCEPTTLEKVVEDINDSCKRAKAQGYNNDEKWQIVKVERNTIYDDDGVFCCSSETQKVVAFYDNGKVTIIR